MIYLFIALLICLVRCFVVCSFVYACRHPCIFIINLFVCSFIVQLISKAEKWALQSSGVQIILCTCVTAGSHPIATFCNIQQCIVDECGMCLETESLIPITSSGVRQVVLIGDHKQLQPVTQDQMAKTLGLSISMFERLSKRALMLEIQYRMVTKIVNSGA